MYERRPARHLHPSELAWFAFDPTEFVEVAREQEADNPGLADRLAMVTRAAWQCAAYLAFQEPVAGGSEVAVEIEQGGGEVYLVDLDKDGNPVGIEFLSQLPCGSG